MVGVAVTMATVPVAVAVAGVPVAVLVAPTVLGAVTVAVPASAATPNDELDPCTVAAGRAPEKLPRLLEMATIIGINRKHQPKYRRIRLPPIHTCPAVR